MSRAGLSRSGSPSSPARDADSIPLRTLAHSRLGPAQPLAITWNSAGAGLVLSQSRQVNFSQTCWMTFHSAN